MTLSTVESGLVMSTKIINRPRLGPLFLIALLVAGCLQAPQNAETDPVEAFKAGFSGVYAEHCAQGHGGRLTFDTSGHLFFSVGMKGAQEHIGMQDRSTPYGKIHRIRDDGSIPADNPFVNTPGAMSSIRSYGHRNPQGLDYDPATCLSPRSSQQSCTAT